jgi:putative transposase
LLGKDWALTPKIIEFLAEALVGELEAHIEAGEEPNRKNGKLPKTLKTNFGQVAIQTPRDRNGIFASERVGKRQRILGLDLAR